MGKLAGRKALVTGGAQGIGGEIAAAFAREGADVAILDRKLAAAEEAAGRLAALGVRSLAVGGDVGDEGDVTRAVAAVDKAFGRIDILVNNAGIDTVSPVATMTTELWDEMMRVNLRSVFLCTRAVLPGMIHRQWGRIISLASQLAHKGAADMAHYAAAKAGVIGFTRSLAYEVAREGITVNCICPGPVDTELFRNIPEGWRRRKLANCRSAGPAGSTRSPRRRCCSPPTRARSSSAPAST
ncbi:MAG: SDR family NAD(P)-dependent oxidoreductase [Geminicoccaceae bacterium]